MEKIYQKVKFYRKFPKLRINCLNPFKCLSFNQMKKADQMKVNKINYISYKSIDKFIYLTSIQILHAKIRDHGHYRLGCLRYCLESHQ
jgi:hypothetical protein